MQRGSGCDALAYITAPGRNTFLIDSRRYPLSLAGSTLFMNVEEYRPGATDLFSVRITGGGATFTRLGTDGSIVRAIGLRDPRGILAELFSPPVAYSNTASITFDADGGIANWSFGVTTGGSGDYGSSGPNGFGSESMANGAETARTGRWSVTVSTVPLPASGMMLAGGLVLLALRRRRSFGDGQDSHAGN